MKINSILFITMMTFSLIAQDKSGDFNSDFKTDMRMSDIISKGNFYRFTRFSPVNYSDRFDHYSSPSVGYYINGLPFNLFPFNHRSIDLLPTDQILLGRYYTGYDETATGYSVKIDEKEISKGREFNGRIFTGSETGDPIIFTFTRENPGTSNKNKIVPSGTISYSVGNGKNRLRIAAGYFGYFATGSYNDPVLFSLSNYFTGRQNKQFFGSVSSQNYFDNDAVLNIFGSAITFYGWEITPFINTFHHFESYLYSGGVQYFTADSKVKLTIKKDGLITETHNINGWRPLKYVTDDYQFIGEFELVANKQFSSDLRVETSFLTAENLRPRNTEHFQNYLSEDIKQISFSPMLSARYKFDDNTSASLSLAYKYGLRNKSAVSGRLNLNFAPDASQLIFVSLSSISRFPGIDELFGKIISEPDQIKNNQSLLFTISGNTDLKPEKLHDITAGYSATLRDLTFNLSIFYSEIVDPIMQIPSLIVRTGDGEVLRNAVYMNHIAENIFGARISFSYNLFSFLLLKGNYFRNVSGDQRYVPKNRFDLTSEAEFPFSAKLIFQFASRGKIMWKDFIVHPGNDYLYGTGSNGILENFNIFSISYIQKLILPGLFEELLVKINIENIFDKDAFFHPLGNRMDRTITASAFIKIL